MRKGVPLSPGIAVARAYRVDGLFARCEPTQLEGDSLSAEVTRFINACAAATQDIDAVIARVSKEVGEEEADIFRAHRSFLRDPAFLGKVSDTILTKKVDACTALHDVLDEYSRLFKRIPDEYMRERMADIRDVVGRIQTFLSARHNGSPGIEEDEEIIVVAPEILPSQAMAFERTRVAGMVTEVGGTTGHAAILARSLGIPAVSGLTGILSDINTGDLLAVDGREGYVYVNPGPEAVAAYRKLQREFVDLRDRMIENRDQQPITKDDITIELLTNVSGPEDAAMSHKVGASGIGLYRTEYLFLTHASVPDEEEQFNAYREVIEAAPNKTVTVRTLDLGGDKQVPYFGTQHESNPFMGWRSVRLVSAHPEFFQTQLRAILRAAHFGKVSLLFPMISTVEEVQQLQRLVQRAKLDLQKRGLPHHDQIPIGVMLEVPAAALCIDSLLEEADFISIGSNDLIQYVMAADRDNPKVAHLCEPFSPPIMRLLNHVIKACNAQRKPVTLCGEMAGRPRCFLPLFGMGLRRFSMSPGFVPPLKEVVRRSTRAMALDAAKRVLHMRTANEIRNYLTRRVRQVCPDVAMLDVRR